MRKYETTRNERDEYEMAGVSRVTSGAHESQGQNKQQRYDDDKEGRDLYAEWF